MVIRVHSGPWDWLTTLNYLRDVLTAWQVNRIITHILSNTHFRKPGRIWFLIILNDIIHKMRWGQRRKVNYFPRGVTVTHCHTSCHTHQSSRKLVLPSPVNVNKTVVLVNGLNDIEIIYLRFDNEKWKNETSMCLTFLFVNNDEPACKKLANLQSELSI